MDGPKGVCSDPKTLDSNLLTLNGNEIYAFDCKSQTLGHKP